MANVTYILAGLLVLVGIYAAFRLMAALSAYQRFRGKRLVRCPETRKPAAVSVAAGELAVGILGGEPRLRLSECSRWPERQECGQECLSQVEADPASCLVWNLIADWYRGKKCVYCGREFGAINWHDHRPALADEQGTTVQWTEVPAEQLPEVLSTHWPVCWDCHIAEKFRHDHPDLVVERQQH
jgi:hypothetical protein